MLDDHTKIHPYLGMEGKILGQGIVGVDNWSQLHFDHYTMWPGECSWCWDNNPLYLVEFDNGVQRMVHEYNLGDEETNPDA